MKSITRIVLTTIAFCAFTFSSHAQKIAHIDIDSLIFAMPEYPAAKKASEDYYKQLLSQLEGMQKEYQEKLAEYQEKSKPGANAWSDAIKAVKEKEIRDLEQRIQEFQQTAQSDFQKKNEELTKPINVKARKAIEQVAKENGYKYVLDSGKGGGIVLYSEPTDDIMPKVKAKLGMK